MAAAEIQAAMRAKESHAHAEIQRIAQERERAEKLRQALKQKLDKAKERIERTGVRLACRGPCGRCWP